MKNLLYIGNKLSQHGVPVTTIETLGPLLKDEGYNLYYASSKKSMALRMLDMLWKVVQLNNKVDLILIDTYSTSSFWYAFFVSQLARLLRIQYIPILHGGNLPNRLENNPRLCRMLFSNAYKNVAPSRYLLHHFELKGFTNTVYIPNTLEIDNYTYKERKVVSPNLLWVRSFARIYNPNMAIEVFKIIKDKYPEATLCMVGPDKDGSLEEAKLLASNYGLNVNFTGKLSKKEWIALSEDYNLFINTTHFDNTPVSVMEAMALGLPVITTNVGGIPYLLDNGVDALLVEDRSVNQMVGAIETLCEDENLAQALRRNARSKTESFDWQIVKEAWEEILECRF
ncbi:glycosyltransferase involved in cell wall biosynthesis [Flavobacterium arsenatis]|uniref:Glycosyltransferase involved in cell wall biosynthesis n=1 Tax=Flavobacterium arsenatis TaxID=1484332 RepID=A0ABU1TM12_9FLAO|nr:glycosyltransferase family 4 protein [Flavobacterium arsenatis]MDR6967006.1 glycosyltransferase involved in cell wall biosynthesis [Flavobacterium arsenatis]